MGTAELHGTKTMQTLALRQGGCEVPSAFAHEGVGSCLLPF